MQPPKPLSREEQIWLIQQHGIPVCFNGKRRRCNAIPIAGHAYYIPHGWVMSKISCDTLIAQGVKFSIFTHYCWLTDCTLRFNSPYHQYKINVFPNYIFRGWDE